MRIDLGLVLAIVVEYILFLYYAEKLFYRKRDKWRCALIAGALYVLNLIVCMFGNIPLNETVYFIINFLGLRLCYHINNKNAAFHSALIVALESASEWSIVIIPPLGLEMSNPLNITPVQSMILTIISRLIFLALILIVCRFSAKKDSESSPSLILVAVPVVTTAYLVLMTRLTTNRMVFAAFGIVLIVVNLLILVINQNILQKESENAALREQAIKDKIDYEEYRLLKERDEELRIFRHDFKAHINTLNALIGDDNQEAKSYIASMAQEGSRSRYTEYTDNKILNILLSEK